MQSTFFFRWETGFSCVMLGRTVFFCFGRHPHKTPALREFGLILQPLQHCQQHSVHGPWQAWQLRGRENGCFRGHWITPSSKYMAQSQKGELIQGLYNRYMVTVPSTFTLAYLFWGDQTNANVWWFWGISLTIMHCLGWLIWSPWFNARFWFRMCNSRDEGDMWLVAEDWEKWWPKQCCQTVYYLIYYALAPLADSSCDSWCKSAGIRFKE